MDNDMKIFTVAIIGCGSRGHDAYGVPIFNAKDKFKIVSVCDTNKVKLEQAKKDFELNDEDCFLDDQEFFKKKRADIIVIATLDKDHVWMSIRALELGYDILLEKPISSSKKELKALLKANKKYGKHIMVCHVLRYAPAFIKVKEILNSGTIGRLVRIESIEQVAYWHQAHSFVRGNWRNDKTTSSMIMQKCCHDLDLMQYYAGSKCDSVFSTGDLTFFNKDNQPKDAADRCKDCKYINSCPYSAERIYVERWNKYSKPVNSWPYNVIDETRPNTAESLRKAYEEGPYGRCVFACDNNVVDNQMVAMNFANGVKATLTMTAFTEDMGRVMTFHGTLGEIKFSESEDTIVLSVFGKDKEVMKVSELISKNAKDSFGHGGGDIGLLGTLYDTVMDKCTSETSIESSVESHFMAISAEKSRKAGKVVKIRR